MTHAEAVTLAERIKAALPDIPTVDPMEADDTWFVFVSIYEE